MLRATVRNKKLLYKIKYSVSNNPQGWNGVNYTEILTKEEKTEKQMIEHIRANAPGHICVYADVNVLSCWLDEIKITRII